MTTTDQNDTWKARFDVMKAEREAFLASCQAVPVTASDYAGWLSAWIEGGGSVDYFRDGPFKPYSSWKKPTVSTDMPIPTGYGACLLKLLVTATTTLVPHHPTSGDTRKGWEWGHTKVCVLAPGPVGNRAWTNSSVTCYVDDIPLLSDEAQEIVRGLQRGEMEKRTYRRSLPAPTAPASTPIEAPAFEQADDMDTLEVIPVETPALEQANDTDTSTEVDTSSSSPEPEDDAYSLGRAVVDEINQRCGVDITLPTQAPLQQAIALPQQAPVHNRKLWLTLAATLVVLLALGGIFIL